jgi:hypothetical protein
MSAVSQLEAGVTGVSAQALRPVGNVRSVVETHATVTKLSVTVGCLVPTACLATEIGAVLSYAV